MEPIPTQGESVEQKGVRFTIRLATSLIRKRREVGKHQRGLSVASRNPFLPYDPNLFVADISDTHICLLNKYNVLDQHLLIVTRAFEHQDCVLGLADFVAMWACLAELDGLAFYNGGTRAGASQPHKHLQLVPFHLAPEGPRVPIETLLQRTDFVAEQGAVGVIAPLAFAHRFTWLDQEQMASPRAAAEHTLARYRVMLQSAGVTTAGSAAVDPYNLLVTREWMLLVARACESFVTISINALGFAGSLFVRTPKELQIIKANGPMTILEHVAAPRAAKKRL